MYAHPTHSIPTENVEKMTVVRASRVHQFHSEVPSIPFLIQVGTLKHQKRFHSNWALPRPNTSDLPESILPSHQFTTSPSFMELRNKT